MSGRRIFLNSVTGACLFATNVVVSFIMSPVIVRELGNQDYGLWELLLGLIGYFGILELGVGPAVVRYVAFADARNDREQLNRVFNSTLLVLGLLGAMGLVIMLLISLKPEMILKVEAGQIGHSTLLFTLIGLDLLVIFPGTAIISYLMGLQRHSLVNILRIGTAIVQSVVTYIALTRWEGPRLVWIAAIVLGSTLVQYVILSLWILLVDRGVQIRPRHFSWPMMKELFVFGLKSMMLSAAANIQKQTMPFVIANMVGVARIPFFAIPSRLVDYAGNFVAMLSIPLIPYFTALSGRGDLAATRQAWFTLGRILQFVLLGIPLATIALGEPFLKRWMGPEYALEGRWVVFFMSIPLIAGGISCNSSRVLFATGRHGRAALLAMILVPFTVALSIPLASRYGIAGAAFAVMVFHVGCALGQLFLALREIQVSLAEHLRGTASKSVVPLVICGLTFWGLRSHSFPETYLAILLQGLLAGGVYALSAWAFSITKEERALLLSRALKRKKRTPVASV